MLNGRRKIILSRNESLLCYLQHTTSYSLRLDFVAILKIAFRVKEGCELLNKKKEEIEKKFYLTPTQPKVNKSSIWKRNNFLY